VRAIEHIEELDAKLERHLLPDLEHAAEAELLSRMTLIAVIVVIAGRRAESSGGGARPGVLVQDELLVRIDAMAVQVLEEERLAGDTIHERPRRGGRTVLTGRNRSVIALEQQRLEIVLRDRRF